MHTSNSYKQPPQKQQTQAKQMLNLLPSAKKVGKALALFTCALPVFAKNYNMLEHVPLKHIKSGEKQAIVANQKAATIVMIFQPDCPWCKKQGQTLAKLLAQCGQHLNFSLVGVKGNNRALKRELSHFDQALPAYYANKPFLRTIGGIEASPTTLFFDEHGKLLLKKRGYIQPEKLKNAAKQLSHNSCTSPTLFNTANQRVAE